MFVDKPDRFSSCAILPGRTADPDGFVTEHRALDGINGPIKLFFSVRGLRHLAQKYPQVGLVSVDELREAQATAQQLVTQLEQAVRERDEAVEALDGFRRALKQMGFPALEQAIKPRPPKKRA